MPRVIAVHSFRGGTGKSNLTANLAATLALAGHRVAVVDIDIQSPGIHVLFGLDEQHVERSLNDYLWGRCAIQDAAYDVSATLPRERGAAVASRGGLYLVPSSIQAGEIARILREGYDVDLLAAGAQALLAELHLDYLLLDTHPGLNEETLLCLAMSDLSLVVLRPDRQDYQGTAVTLEVARKLNVPHLLLLVNMVLPTVDFDALRQEVERAYSTPVAGIFPLSEDVVQLASSGIFCLSYPDHPWTRALQGVAGQLAG
jgi:MinD-like ATPase involved in chromosome partitioning or flagellar assembly